MVDSSGDLEAPLLEPPENGTSSTNQGGDEPVDIAITPFSPSRRCTSYQSTCNKNGGVANLVITAVGAGALALPKAIESVGIASGIVLFLAVACITYTCASIIATSALETGKSSYGQLIMSEFGKTGGFLLQASVCIHVIGVMIVYLIIIADLLVGNAPEWHGILPTLLNRHDAPWWLQRNFVSMTLAVGVLPMLMPRSLTAVSRFSKVTVVLITAIATTTVTLAVLALIDGKAATDVHFWPYTEPGQDFIDVLTRHLSVVSVSCLAFTMHFNLTAIQTSLRDKQQMPAVVFEGIGLCTVFYLLVGLSGYVLFGGNTKGDVLMNLTIHFVSKIVHPLIAKLLISCIGLAYVGCLCVNFVLKVWALRENFCEIFFGTSHMELSNTIYYATTLGLVASSFLFSSFCTGIFFIINVVGSTACVMFSFIFPGALILKRSKTSGWDAVAGAVLVIGLGMLMAAITVFDVVTGRNTDV